MIANPEAWRPALDRFQRLALIVGVVGAVLCGVGAFLGPAQFFYSFTFAFFFWMTLTIGSSIVLMIQHMTGGVWGLMLRRLLEAAVMTLPLMAVLFLVIILGANDIYRWMHPEEVAASEVIQYKSNYLNLPFFIVRAVIYFAIWILFAFLLNRWSSEQDAKGDPDKAIADRLARLSGPGIVLFVLIWTLAATDWGMSLEPEWFSSMYPVTFIAEGILVTFAWGVIALALLRSRGMLPYSIPVDRLHDLGKFMFAFTVIWTYINFSQYLIIWSGNIAEETPWYFHRLNGGWQVLAVTLMFGHFFLPFFALLSRRPKRNLTALTVIACYLVVIQVVFVFWTIMPAFFSEGIHIHVLDPIALVAVGGLWLALFVRNLKSKPLLPPNDYRLPELIRQSSGDAHGHGHHAPEHGETAHSH